MIAHSEITAEKQQLALRHAGACCTGALRQRLDGGRASEYGGHRKRVARRHQHLGLLHTGGQGKSTRCTHAARAQADDVGIACSKNLATGGAIDQGTQFGRNVVAHLRFQFGTGFALGVELQVFAGDGVGDVFVGQARQDKLVAHTVITGQGECFRLGLRRSHALDRHAAARGRNGRIQSRFDSGCAGVSRQVGGGVSLAIHDQLQAVTRCLGRILARLRPSVGLDRQTLHLIGRLIERQHLGALLETQSAAERQEIAHLRCHLTLHPQQRAQVAIHLQANITAWACAHGVGIQVA